MAGGKRRVTAKSKKRAPAKSAKGPPRKPVKTAKAPPRKPAKPVKKAPAAPPRAKPTTIRARSAAKPATTRARSNAPAQASGNADLRNDKLHQVAMTATNLDASVAFYRDTLGLPFIARFDPPGLAFFNLGGSVRLMLSATSSSATLYFLVDDLKSAYRLYGKRGVRFLQPPALIHRDEAGDFGKKGGQEWMAFFRDPGGNMLALVEKR